MKNRRILRMAAIVLAVVLALGAAVAVGAAGYPGDMDGDGRITAFDAQMLAEYRAGRRQLNETQQKVADKTSIADIMSYIFGDFSVDTGDLNGDGVTEIYNAAGLATMAENPDDDYILAANIDLQGDVWTPIASFSGSFDGAGYTISNLTISAAVDANQGFFGDVAADAVVTDLALRNVTLNAAADAQKIGLVAGTSQGTIEGCTVTGAINDARTALGESDSIYVGVLVGDVVSGTVTGGTSVTSYDDTNTHAATGLCADAKLYIQSSDTVVNGGLYGQLAEGASVTGIWRDSTNNVSNESETIQARQNEVVDYMYAMANVEWTVSEKIEYQSYATDGTTPNLHWQTFEPGVTYKGLPYNHRNGSLERFLSCMEIKDGTYVTKTGLGSSKYVKNNSEVNEAMTGFALYMGNDCSTAVGWAWMQVSPNRVGTLKIENGVAVDKDPTEYAGGAWVVNTALMVPSVKTIDATISGVAGTKTYQQTYGIYPVGDWTTVGVQGDKNADDVIGTFAYEVGTLANSADVRDLNGDTVMAEAYAAAHKADAIVGGDPSGHARLLTSYPVVIRDADGNIDLYKSFLVCTEQGDGLYDGNNSSWRVDYKWTFWNLLGYEKTESINYSRVAYLPITIRALHADYVKHAYVDEYPQSDDYPEVCPVSGPATGKIYSNWRILSTTVIVRDKDTQETLFSNTVYTGLEVKNTTDGIKHDDYNHGTGENVLLSWAHGDAFAAFAAENLTDGQVYEYSVQVHLANGETLILNRDCLGGKHSGSEFETFTYHAS